MMLNRIGIILLVTFAQKCIASEPNHFHIAITLNTTWTPLCPQIELFRAGLSYLIKLDYNRIVFENEKDHCVNNKDNLAQVTLYFFAISTDAKGVTLDIKATLAAEKELYKGAIIGRYTIVSFELKNTAGIEKVVYSTKTILIVIGIVLLIYLMGYFLILSMKSYSTRTDTKERPLSFVLAAENIHFTKEDGPLGKRSRKGDKHKLLSLTKKSTSSSRLKGNTMRTAHK